MNKRYEEMERWYRGDSSLQPSLSRIRKWLITRFGSTCSECGFYGQNPFSGKVILELHHQDGNHENNSPNNLSLLCPNCHATTVTYKGLNTVSSGVYTPIAENYLE